MDEVLEELRAMQAWGYKPKEWRAESVDDRAEMVMYTLWTATVEAYRQEWREKRRTKEEDRRDRDENTFRKLKQRLQGKS